MTRKRDIGLMLIALSIVLALWWIGAMPAGGQEMTPVPLPGLICDDCTRLPLVLR